MKKLLPISAIALLFTFCSSPKPNAVSIIPQPAKMEIGQGGYTLNPGATIASDSSLREVAQYLAQSIEKSTGLKLVLTDASQGDITLINSLENKNPEAYTLTVDSKGVQINGSTPAGVIMGAATLQQLLPLNSSNGGTIAQVNITDEPRFAYRGLMLDVSRHFYSVEQVKELLDLMARYKLNKFHWHLTDDQGWRIEIKKYPLLTEKGAWRKFNNQDRQCQAYQKELDDTDFAIPEEFMKINGTDTLYGGFYTQDQIKDVVAYATTRGIDILPEVDMPGHFMAAIIGYPEISCKGEARFGELFSDPICVGKDETIAFVKDIYTEIAALFPYEYMHLGADEVEKTNWKACPNCQKRMREQSLKTEEELQAWFVKDMEKHFTSLNKKMIGWDEIIEGGLSPTATIMWWRNWAPKAVPTATASGNRVIMSPCFSLYLDAWESKDTFENTYNYEPILKDLTPEQASLVMGVQGNLWCETIPNTRRAYHQYFPRVLALSEIGWVDPSTKNWEQFQQKFIREVDFLDAKGINYRIPDLTGFSDINVFTDTATVTVNSVLPNITIRYTADGSFPNIESPTYTQPIKITESTNYIFRGFRPDGTMGEMYKSEFRKEAYSAPVAVDATKSGLLFKQYENKGKKCADIISAPFVREFVAQNVNMSKEIVGWMGLIGTGYIEIPEDGIYTFSLTSNDGSMLYVDNTLLIDNDNPHGDKTLVAQKAMAKGLHPIKIEFFDLNNGGKLELKWKRPADTEFSIIENYKH